MTCLLKRVLPFVLTASIGIVIVNRLDLYDRPVPKMESVIGANQISRIYSYYYEDCRCMVWTTDSKMWVSIKELPKPNFTEAARQNDFTGGVEMHVLLGADGKVAKAEPYGPLPYGLTEEIVNAAKHIQFDPASVFDGKPESVWITIAYEFKTVPGILGKTYETRVFVFDHYDVDRDGRERRLER